MLPWTHPSPHPKRHLDPFRRFCTAQLWQTISIFYNGPPPPSKLHLRIEGLDPIWYTVSWFHPSLHPKRHLNRFSRFCRVHGRDRPTDRQTDRPHRVLWWWVDLCIAKTWQDSINEQSRMKFNFFRTGSQWVLRVNDSHIRVLPPSDFQHGGTFDSVVIAAHWSEYQDIRGRENGHLIPNWMWSVLAYWRQIIPTG